MIEEGKLNNAIKYIRDLCKSCNTCVECHMNNNCNEQPAHWKDLETEYRQKWGILS